MRRIIKGIKGGILTILRKFGYELRNIKPHDLTGTGKNALNVHLFDQLPEPVVVNVPMKRLRQRYWFSLTEEMNPFVATLARYRDQEYISYAGSSLEDYFRLFSPNDIIEAIGLKPSEAPDFAGVDALGYCLPWKNGSPESKIKLRERVIREEALKFGVKISGEDGWPDFGPVSQRLGQLEMDMLISVYESIKVEGYRRHSGRDGDLRGQIFIDSELNWCVNVWWGNHRLASVAALGYEAIPVRFETMPIRDSEVSRWPQVMNRNIEREAALRIFRRVLSATPPPACNWNPYKNKQ